MRTDTPGVGIRALLKVIPRVIGRTKIPGEFNLARSNDLPRRVGPSRVKPSENPTLVYAFRVSTHGILLLRFAARREERAVLKRLILSER